MSSLIYAGVVVDAPGPVGDRVFHYRIPSELRGQLTLGDQVSVPFQSRRCSGYVVEKTAETALARVKDVAGITAPGVLDQSMLELAWWVARRYNATWLEGLHCVLPPGYPHGVARKTQTWVKLAGPREMVLEAKGQLPARATKQRAVVEQLLKTGGEALMADLLSQCDCSRAPVESLVEKGLVNLDHRPATPVTDTGDPHFLYSQPTRLTPHQQRAVEELERGQGQGHLYLLHGVAASGKTEVYLRFCGHLLERGRSALVLVPEIALIPQVLARFQHRFGSRALPWHSRLPLGERQHVWWRLREGQPLVVVGARSAVFLPSTVLGAIIMDEEHENTYKQDENPRYHTREVAEYRARTHKATVVLGSATPAVESFSKAVTGEYTRLSLPDRAGPGSRPDVALVDMREELSRGNWSLISSRLQSELQIIAAEGRQAVLFLNRRGYAPFVLCRQCGHVLECPNCDVSLSYHSHGHRLVCHYCRYSETMPPSCPQCQSEYIRHFGAGTQRVQKELSSLFPGISSHILDADFVNRRHKLDQILKTFASGQINVLIGTQMVAKGLDLPGVGLAGIIDADTALHLPDYRGAERTFQLLSQMAGRAGRGQQAGQVVVQTYNPGHYSIRMAVNGDYEGFYAEETQFRRKFNYPPWGELLAVMVAGPEEDLVATWARQLEQRLHREKGPQDLVYPAGPAILSRLRRRYRYQVFVKGPDLSQRWEQWRQLRREFEWSLRGQEAGLHFDFHPSLPG